MKATPQEEHANVHPGGVQIANMDFDSPEGVDEVIQPLVGGVSARATRERGFRARIRAWNLGGETFLNFATENAVAVFDERRSWGTVNISQFSTSRLRVGSRECCLRDGELHLFAPDMKGEIEPGNRAQLLGFSVDWNRLAQHLSAATGPRNEVDTLPITPLSTESAEGRCFKSYIDRLCWELNDPDAQLGHARVAGEAIDTIEYLLAAVVAASLERRTENMHADAVSRVRDLLAEDLESLVSLSDVALMGEISTRSLLRAFQKVYGTSPMAFRRRLRFDAARHDLFFSGHEETSVTVVANRYRFDHLGRFAVEYRKLFGESPSDTLRR